MHHFFNLKTTNCQHKIQTVSSKRLIELSTSFQVHVKRIAHHIYNISTGKTVRQVG